MANKIDYKFISDREGGRQLLGYVPHGGGSKSGVTVATGFDLGQRNEADLKKLKLPTTLIDKLKPYLGLTKKNAIDAIKKKPLMVGSVDVSFLPLLETLFSSNKAEGAQFGRFK